MDLTRLVLSKSPFPNISSKELAEQIAGKKIAEKKLPSWFNSPFIYYPQKLALEQCSSEQTAAYKSRLLRGKTLVDLTGGMGVDTFAFARKAEQVIHIEKQAQLSEIARHNAQALGLKNVQFVVSDAENWIENTSAYYETVYLDPSRRVSGQKVFRLSDCEPNIVQLQEKIFEFCPYIIVKTAPLLDIKSGLTELKQVSEIHVISVNNEMKEVLWVLDKDFQGTEPTIYCIGLSNSEEYSYAFRLSEEKNYQIDHYAKVQDYLYEPDAAWLKAGCFKTITQRYNIGKLHAHTHLYTSDIMLNDFPGRKFKVNRLYSYKEFCKSEMPKQANISCRNFPLNPTEIQAKHKIKDGGLQYLFFCTDEQNELIVVETQKL